MFHYVVLLEVRGVTCSYSNVWLVYSALIMPFDKKDLKSIFAHPTILLYYFSISYTGIPIPCALLDDADLPQCDLNTAVCTPALDSPSFIHHDAVSVVIALP